MAIEVTTKDCSTLGDVEFAELAAVCADNEGLDVGSLSKQAGEWVLLCRAYAAEDLCGFMFSTLERIGGTPAIIVGLAKTTPDDRRPSVLAALMSEQYHRALMAFPDEDVVVAVRINSSGGFEALSGLGGIRPWPGVRVDGEERAWGRRLAKMYGSDSFDDRSMVARDERGCLVVAHESSDASIKQEVAPLVGSLVGSDEMLIGWGWAYSEFLEEFTK